MTVTPKERAARVVAAMVALADSVEAAATALEAYGPTDPRTLAAWAEVEASGATIHRQSRLLAGKSRGG